MTKFDIRLRRKQFTQNRIERHKNYQSILERHQEANKRKTRGITVLVILIIIIIATALAFFGTLGDDKQQDENKDKTEQTREYTETEDIAKVYKL